MRNFQRIETLGDNLPGIIENDGRVYLVNVIFTVIRAFVKELIAEGVYVVKPLERFWTSLREVSEIGAQQNFWSIFVRIQ